jgi:hypothetical protein
MPVRVSCFDALQKRNRPLTASDRLLIATRHGTWLVIVPVASALAFAPKNRPTRVGGWNRVRARAGSGGVLVRCELSCSRKPARRSPQRGQRRCRRSSDRVSGGGHDRSAGVGRDSRPTRPCMRASCAGTSALTPGLARPRARDQELGALSRSNVVRDRDRSTLHRSGPFSPAAVTWPSWRRGWQPRRFPRRDAADEIGYVPHSLAAHQARGDRGPVAARAVDDEWPLAGTRC